MGSSHKQEASRKLKRLKDFFRPSGRRQQPQTPVASEDGMNPLTPSRTLTFSSYWDGANEEKGRRLQVGKDLYQAVADDDLDKVIELYQNHASLRPRDQRDRTALHAAAELGRNDILRFLLEQKGLDLDAADVSGYTALHLAALNDHSDCVFWLLERGANAELVDGSGHLPDFYASSPETERQFKNPPIVHTGHQHAAVNHLTLNDVYKTQPPDKVEGPRRAVCEYFQGSFWEPNISTKWRILPVWDLAYEPKDDLFLRFDMVRRQDVPKNKWIHLPVASRELVLDLTKSIYAASGHDFHMYKTIEKLINDMFKQVDVAGAEGKVHFKVCTVPFEDHCVIHSVG